MIPARRKNLPDPGVESSHAGLILASYLKTTDDKGKSKVALLEQAIKSAKEAKAIYRLAFERWKTRTSGATDACVDLKVKGRMIVGLGGESVLETGITLHHTYGTPIIPGTAVKGLAAHYCHRELGLQNPDLREGGAHYQTIFGTTDDSGYVVFHDSWIDPESIGPENSGLVRDVMTPHHADYYAKKGDSPPSDFDDPNPVTFLAVTGTFRVVVSCDNKEWAAFTLKLVKAALKEWGVGGKTNAGYGRMDRV
jgi:CRISPR-associated protein Cmr6